MRATGILSALLLAGCAAQVSSPSPPTPTSIEATLVDLSQISADPTTVWQAGAYAVRSACYVYLNQMASRSADLALAGTGIGMAGAGAAGFLASGGNPAGAAAAGGIAALLQGFLSAFQTSGAMPYTGATTTLVLGAMDAWEGHVDANPPTSVPQAVGAVLDLWWQCSPGGYAQLVLKSAVTAQITTTPAPPAPQPQERYRARKSQSIVAPSDTLQEYLQGRGPLPGFGRAHVLINGR